jgi:tripartite-type tricarboxylate transporter receptor subunit TctC
MNPPSRRRREIVSLVSALALGPAFGMAMAESPRRFPLRPITLWVPWAAGGATDLTLRILAEGASQRLGQKVIVDNRGGAGGTLVMPLLSQAPPDGYTIAQIPQPVFRAPWLQKVLWDPIRDTTPIIQISGVTFGVLAPPSSGFHSFEDVFTWAKAHPGELTVATNGVGTTPHLVMDELFARRGLSYVHVPYKGTSEQMMAVSTGQVMLGVNSSGFAPFVDSGRLRLLVTFGDQRSRRFPQVPTLKELGHGIVANSPYGLAGPHGLDPTVVRVLHDAFKAAMNDPAHLAELERYDQELAYLNAEDYGRAMREAYAQERKNVERLGLAHAS